MQQGQLFQQYHQQHGVYLRGPDSEGSTNNTNTTPSPISPGIGLAMSTSPAGSVNAPQSHTSGEGYASGGNHPAGRDRAVGGSASGAGQSPPGNASNNETSASASAAGAGGKKRKWSVEERQLHSVIEKKRRETLNAKLLTLARNLPTIADKKRLSKSVIAQGALDHVVQERHTILEAIPHIRALLKERDVLTKEVNDWRARVGVLPLSTSAGISESTLEPLLDVEKYTFGTWPGGFTGAEGNDADDGEDDNATANSNMEPVDGRAAGSSSATGLTGSASQTSASNKPPSTDAKTTVSRPRRAQSQSKLHDSTSGSPPHPKPSTTSAIPLPSDPTSTQPALEATASEQGGPESTGRASGNSSSIQDPQASVHPVQTLPNAQLFSASHPDPFYSAFFSQSDGPGLLPDQQFQTTTTSLTPAQAAASLGLASGAGTIQGQFVGGRPSMATGSMMYPQRPLYDIFENAGVTYPMLSAETLDTQALEGPSPITAFLQNYSAPMNADGTLYQPTSPPLPGNSNSLVQPQFPESSSNLDFLSHWPQSPVAGQRHPG